MSSSRELYSFLVEAELEHYNNALCNELKITSSHQLKYVKEEDLTTIGMTKPEMRRLKKYYKKEYPQGIERIYRAIKKTGDAVGSRTLSPPPPEHRLPRPTHLRGSGKQIIPSENLTINKTLGEGEFGVVQQGIWTTEDGERVQVAIKNLAKERMQSAMADFLKEAAIMQSIDHDHVVHMFGVVLDKENTLMLVTELAPMRSLLECLKEPSLRLDFPTPRLCDFAQQICDGMSYLESKRFIHRDLAARNVLVFSKHQVKISDFGLSRALGVGKDYYQTKFTSTLKLPIAWCAPESVSYLKFTSASDSWSYAVTLWEMFTYGFQPWAGLTGQQILESIDKPNCHRLDQPDLCPREYYDLMMKCWEHDPSKRPSFSQLFLKLPQIRPMLVKAVKDYPSPIVQKDYLFYKAYDVIIVLDKSPSNPPVEGLWKGVLNTGKSGYFDPTNTVPFLEPKTSPIERQRPSIVRRESARKSGRRLRLDMIGKPMDDLRHTGHIGYDGAIFGDVGFIGDNVDKLPIKHGNTGLPPGSVEPRGSSISLPRYADSPDRDYSVRNSQSELSLGIATNGHSWMSRESLDSQMTIQSNSTRKDGEKTPPYQDIDDELDWNNFKLPELSTSLDLGPSFMDEVFKALLERETKDEEVEEQPARTPPVPAPKPYITPRREPQATMPKSEQVNRSSSQVQVERFSATRDSTPPPLPTQPPRVDAKKEQKVEVPAKKQAKVKPLSTSDEKMIDKAVNMASELSFQVTNSHMRADSCSPPAAHSEKIRADGSGVVQHVQELSTSPKLMARLKHSLKRSNPKREQRNRTFSEEIATKSELSDELPPESQEAYNILVVRGSDKEYKEHSPEPLVPPRYQDDATVTMNLKYGQVEVRPVTRIPNGSRIPEPSNRTSANASSKPVARPRIELKKPSEPPPPRPRPEVHRVEPTVRPAGSFSDPHRFLKPVSKAPPQAEAEETSDGYLEDSELNTSIGDLKKGSSNSRVDYSSTSSSSSMEREIEKVDSSRKKSEDKRDLKTFEEEFSEPSPREIMSRLARESRMRRTLDHQSGNGDSNEPPIPPRNLREPQGIPGRKGSATSTNEDDGEQDTNPLRMLRGGAIPIRGGRGGPGMDKNASLRLPQLKFSNPSITHGSDGVLVRPPRRPQRSLSHDPTASSSPLSPQIASEPCSVRPPRRPQRSLSYDLSSSSPPPVPPRRSFSSESSPPDQNPPLPPRRPVKTISINCKPRERIHPLVLDTVPTLIPPPRPSSMSPPKSVCESYPYLPPAPPLPLNSTQEAELDLEDNVFLPSSPTRKSAKVEPDWPSRQSWSATFPRRKFRLNNVKCDLEQLGFYDTTDPFWVQQVSVPQEKSSQMNHSDSMDEAEVSPNPRYKTSDNVSYEDLLEFALDREKDCEDVETMRKVFNNEVSVEDCQRALEDTSWDIYHAIKYVKLKQLISIQLGDIHACKQALMRTDWNVHQAVDFMLSRPPNSPDIIAV